MIDSIKNIFSNNAIRLVGAILLFMGILLCLTGETIFTILAQIVAIALIVFSFYVFINCIKNCIKNNTFSKDNFFTLLISFILFVVGILLAIFKDKANTVFLITAGIIMFIYGIVLLCLFIKKFKSQKSLAFYIFVAVITLVSGIFFALLYLPSLAQTAIFYYSAGAVLSLTGIVDLIFF